MIKKEPSQKHHGMPRGNDGNVRLSAKKTKIIREPTVSQSENDVDDVKNSITSKPDQHQKLARMVKEASLAEIALQRYRRKHS